MKRAFIADIHVGNHKRFGGPVTAGINQRCRLILEALERACQRAIQLKCAELYVAGDLFDYSRPEAQVIREVQRVFGHAETEGLNIILLVGNHDQVSDAPGDHALGPLRPVAAVVEQPRIYKGPDQSEVWCVPFKSGRAEDWLPKTLADMEKELGAGAAAVHPPGRSRVLVVHLGIRDEETPPWLENAPDSIPAQLLATLCHKHGIHAAIAGNWHNRERWNFKGDGNEAWGLSPEYTVEVFQLGALAPTGWDNPGLEGYGTLGIWDDGDITYEEIPGPRFVKTKTRMELKEILQLIADSDSVGKVFVSSTEAPEGLEEQSRALQSLCGKSLAGVEVLPDEGVARAQAGNAAQAARSAETFDEALVSFVSKMPLPEGVEPDRVIQRVRSYVR